MINPTKKGTFWFFFNHSRAEREGSNITRHWLEKNQNVPFFRCGGFSLLEVLVAFTILATVLGVAFQIFSSGLNRVGLAEAYSRAVVLAESELARLGAETVVEPGVHRGRIDDTYRWRTTVVPYEEEYEGAQDADARALGVRGLRPYRVTVEIIWGEGDDEHTVPLTTVRRVREG